MHVCVCACIHTLMCVCVCVFTLQNRTFILNNHVYVYTPHARHIHTCSLHSGPVVASVVSVRWFCVFSVNIRRICIHMCINEYMQYTCICTYVQREIYECMHVKFVYIYIYIIYMNIYIYIYIYIIYIYIYTCNICIYLYKYI